jgi:catechol 2,3-dioxygenase-like lactoylglutathione lyase family enzyme
MLAHRLVPILNVSNIRESFAWFEKLGWKKDWDWGDPPSFGGVCSGDCEIFLCENAQGGRGRSDVEMTFGPEGDETGDKGASWGVREMHVRHPDGHVLRISQAIEQHSDWQSAG